MQPERPKEFADLIDVCKRIKKLHAVIAENPRREDDYDDVDHNEHRSEAVAAIMKLKTEVVARVRPLVEALVDAKLVWVEGEDYCVWSADCDSDEILLFGRPPDAILQHVVDDDDE